MKSMTSQLIAVVLATFLVFAAFVNLAGAASKDIEKPEELVEKALVTFNNFSADPNMTWFRDNIGKAKAIIIYPRIIRAGFLLGGSGGSGVLLHLDGKTGQWSYPAFYTMGSGSFGFQAGVDFSEVVLLVMTQKGMDSLLSTEFKLGADVSIAAGPVGAGAKSQTVDVLSYSRAKGVFGGISFEGAVIKPRDKWNSAYYGKPVRTIDIAVKRNVSNPDADALRSAVSKTAGK
jgi:lipid-binding SYLF domain-containing protein